MNNKPEAKIQVAIVNHILLAHPKLLWSANPHAGFSMRIGQAVMAKAMGYQKGTPDVMIFEPRGRFHGLFLELKSTEGSVSLAQSAFLAKASDKGYATAVCYSAAQGIQTLENYLKIS